MTSAGTESLSVQRAIERMRQERETFDQRKRQDAQWFFLTLLTGYAAVGLLTTILAVSGFVMVNHEDFSNSIVVLAAGAMFVDSLGIIASVWGVVINSGSPRTRLKPVTDEDALLIDESGSRTDEE